MNVRQVVLDTETTGLDPEQGHKIIEIGCVEVVNRKPTGNNYHQYINPEREIEQGAFEVHGISNDFLADKPTFPVVAGDLIEYLRGAELIIHNAPFDVGFLNHELRAAGQEWGKIEDHCEVFDTLAQARQLHPGQRNDLNSLCGRYEIDNSERTLHGALLDAEILAEVYLAMSGGQTALLLDEFEVEATGGRARRAAKRRADVKLKVVYPDAEEAERHHRWVERLERRSGGTSNFSKLE